jgi:hypothetical protein
MAIKLTLNRFESTIAESFFNLYTKLDEDIKQDVPAASIPIP